MDRATFLKKLSAAESRHATRIKSLRQESEIRREAMNDAIHGHNLDVITPQVAVESAIAWGGALTRSEICEVLECGLESEAMRSIELFLKAVEVERLDDSPGGNGIRKEIAYLWQG